MRTDTWTDRDSQQNHTKQVVEVSDRFGEVGGSFKFVAARIERQRPTTGEQVRPADSAADSATG